MGSITILLYNVLVCYGAQIWAHGKNVFYHPQIHTHMKKIELSVREFYMFKNIATFFYLITVKKDIVEIEADRFDLELLGY